MAMSRDPESYRIDESLLLSRRCGNDTTPLVSMVPDQPYSRGVVTSQGRTNSPQYMAFLKRARDEAKRARP